MVLNLDMAPKGINSRLAHRMKKGNSTKFKVSSFTASWLGGFQELSNILCVNNKRVGVTRLEKNFFDHNIYSWQGKQYDSREALFAALDKAGIHAKKVIRRLHTVYPLSPIPPMNNRFPQKSLHLLGNIFPAAAYKEQKTKRQ